MPKVDPSVWKYAVTVLISVLLTAGGHFLVLGKDVATKADVKAIVEEIVPWPKDEREIRARIRELEADVVKNRDKSEEDRKMLIEINTKVELILKKIQGGL